VDHHIIKTKMNSHPSQLAINYVMGILMLECMDNQMVTLWHKPEWNPKLGDPHGKDHTDFMCSHLGEAIPPSLSQEMTNLIATVKIQVLKHTKMPCAGSS
jgi:hypothetical protein